MTTIREPVEFSLDTYLSMVDPRLFEIAEGRRAVTRLDPLMFGLVYLPHHLRGPETGDEITFSEFHLDVVDQARRWVLPSEDPGQDRDIYVAPRGAAKSTWFFLILPLWAAAHGHKRFIAAFADTATQAELHLKTFRMEVEQNQFLRHDFPDLCTPGRRMTGVSEADRSNLYMARSRFAFMAKGIDSTTLGAKLAERRPDLLLLDDIEPGEENYSPAQKDKRLAAITDSVLPLNIYARVVVVGTVTMAGSIIHDAVRSVTTTDEPAQWLVDENFRVHYYNAILDDGLGTERSLWPEKWPLSYLNEIRHTRAYKKNMANDPAGSGGEYWRDTDFTYGTVAAMTHQLLSIDPAVTSKKTSDYTGLAVIGYSAAEHRCVVRWARAVRLPPGEPLRRRVIALLEQWPQVTGVLVETNQGGDAWRAILHGLPVKVHAVHQTLPKEVRAARLLAYYQRGPRVLHEQRLPDLEDQMVGFPKAPFDDLVDTVGTGVEALMGTGKQTKPSARQGSYV